MSPRIHNLSLLVIEARLTWVMAESMAYKGAVLPRPRMRSSQARGPHERPTAPKARGLSSNTEVARGLLQHRSGAASH